MPKNEIARMQWGYLGKDRGEGSRPAGAARTGLDEYLEAIFPDVDDWIYGQPLAGDRRGRLRRIRPGCRSESLRLIVELDDVRHYQDPAVIQRDEEVSTIYESMGYKVVRIPYFIQLTNSAVETLFGVRVKTPLFDPSCPSLRGPGKGAPARLCPAGIARMAADFRRFPDQYAVNVSALRAAGNDFLTGVELLEEAYRQNRRTGRGTANLVTEAMAEAVHDTWMRGRLSDGWKLGRVRDGARKLHPCLVKYSELPDSEKEYDRATASQVIVFLRNHGYNVVKRALR